MKLDTLYGDPPGYLATMDTAPSTILFTSETVDDYKEVLSQVRDMLDTFWQTDDPLMRLESVLAAQRRIDSIL